MHSRETTAMTEKRKRNSRSWTASEIKRQEHIQAIRVVDAAQELERTKQWYCAELVAWRRFQKAKAAQKLPNSESKSLLRLPRSPVVRAPEHSVDDSFAIMLWDWFERRGADLRPEELTGLTAEDFRLMLDVHEREIFEGCAKIAERISRPEVSYTGWVNYFRKTLGTKIAKAIRDASKVGEV
jgi:hypothetical protein